jgi:hypothetical protein
VQLETTEILIGRRVRRSTEAKWRTLMSSIMRRRSGVMHSSIIDTPVRSEVANKRAALKLMCKLLKKYGFVPGKLVMQPPTTPSTSNVISAQQEHTEPSGHRPC